jgi:hypothetical protein
MGPVLGKYGCWWATEVLTRKNAKGKIHYSKEGKSESSTQKRG